jgi:hypothetical protein
MMSNGHASGREQVVRLFAWGCVITGVVVAGVIAPIYDESGFGSIAGTWITSFGLLILFGGVR